MSGRALRNFFRILLAALFVFAGSYHFYNPALYRPLMPEYLPRHDELIFISGVFEVTLGLLVLIPRYRRFAGLGLIALLLAVFPANVHMATHPEVYPDVSSFLRWARLPLQAVLIGWVWWVTQVMAPQKGGDDTLATTGRSP